jgi:superfamily II DNA/RNA helicase
MFASAGFNINTVKMFVVDDADILFRLRMDAVIHRLSNSIEKTQRLFFAETLTERVESLADKIMIEPVFFELEEGDEEDDLEEEEDLDESEETEETED